MGGLSTYGNTAKLYDLVGGVPITGDMIVTVTLLDPDPVTKHFSTKLPIIVPSVAFTPSHGMPAVAPATVAVPLSNPAAASRVPVIVPVVPFR